MKNPLVLILLAVSMLTVGCATVKQQSVSLSNDVITSTSGRIGVAMTELPKLNTHFPGADCLLCIAAASLANTSLTKHASTLSYEDIPTIKNELASRLKKTGSDVIVIEESLNLNGLSDYSTKGANIALKNFTPLKQKYNIDKLLVLDINALGYIRTYASYIPTSDPKALMRATGYMVNLSNNTYEWYLPVDVQKSADSVWDEPPKFPGLTNAYYQAIEIAKDQLLKPFPTGPVISSASSNSVQ
jgi:hypothetical protein